RQLRRWLDCNAYKLGPTSVRTVPRRARRHRSLLDPRGFPLDAEARSRSTLESTRLPHVANESRRPVGTSTLEIQNIPRNRPIETIGHSTRRFLPRTGSGHRPLLPRSETPGIDTKGNSGGTDSGTGEGAGATCDARPTRARAESIVRLN